MSAAARASPTNPPRSRASGRSGPRSRLGCLTCRRRKVRCDQSTTAPEARARCSNCIRLELECQYAPQAAQRKPPKRGRGTTSVEKTNPAMQTTSCQDESASNEQSPTGQIDYQEDANASSMPERPFAHSNPEQIGYRYTGEDANEADYIQFDRSVRDMPDLSTLNGELEWPLNFPTGGVTSPANGVFPASFFPWKDFSTGFDLTSNSQHINDQSLELRTTANYLDLPYLPPEPSSWSPTPRHGPERGPRRKLSGIDLSLLDVTEHQRQLLEQFTTEVNPIPLITPTDSQWRSAYSSLISMGFGCPHLINAICSVSELNLVTSKYGSTERAFSYYRSAVAKMESVLNDAPSKVDDRDLKQAFATLFLLMQAEIMAQPLSSTRSWPTTQLRAAHSHLKRHNDRLRLWTGMSNRILSWIRIIDSKVVYAAGMEKDTERLSPKSNIDTHSSPNGSQSAARGSPAPSHFENPDPDATPDDNPFAANIDEPLSAAEIAYDALYQPAYKFFMQCQDFIPRIIALDWHHRQRGSLDAELEVLHIGQRLRHEIREQWKKRPQGLRVLEDTEGLQEVLHPRVACMIIHSFRGFAANFHAIRILLHRVAFLNYPASADVKEAIAEIMRLAHEQVSEEGVPDASATHNANSGTANNVQVQCAADGAGRNTNNIEVQISQNSDTPAAGNTVETIAEPQSTASNAQPQERRKKASSGLHSIMLWLWPLFMCGTECSLIERRWVLERMYAMGSTNADKAAMLLTEVTKRQDETNCRVDQRSVRQKIFSNEFDIVY